MFYGLLGSTVKPFSLERVYSYTEPGK